VELKNMMDEESLELFESQSHLLDPESRRALERQRQYLQWHNSMEEPGPMQSELERQDSAGSGCQLLGSDDGGLPGAFAAAMLDVATDGSGGVIRNQLTRGCGGGGSSAEDTSSGGGSAGVVHELQEARRHLALMAREREALATRVQQLESELETQKDVVLCKICRQAQRNCVVLPCLHFTSCDMCFKRHCVGNVSCPTCSGRITGFQTLLLMS